MASGNDEMNVFIMKKFKNLKTNSERVDFAYNSYASKNPGVLDSVYPRRVEKCDSASVALREQGNEMSHGQKYLEALLLYTQSIAHAENGSSNLGLAYASRSRVLYEKRYYKECLEDIGRALESKYPIHLTEELLNQRAKVLQAENSKFFYYHEPVPTIVNKHPRVPAAADCLELKRNETFGTHIVTTRDVKAGEIISVEKPFVQSIHTESVFINCHECLELCFNMIPCEKCATALYCSTTCREDAFRSYHRYECDFGGVIENNYSAIKIPLIGVMGFKDIKGDSNDDLYQSCNFYDLETNENVLDNDFYYLCAIDVGIMVHCLKERTKFLQEIDLEENILKDIMLRSLIIYYTNSIQIVKKKLVPYNHIGPGGSTIVGRAIYIFSSRYNHSCAPNCQYVCRGTNLIVRSIDEIKKGEQCFISYGPTYLNYDISERHDHLRSSCFTCKCVACENFWPSYKNLSLADHLSAAIIDVEANYTCCRLLVVQKLLDTIEFFSEDVTDIDKEVILSKCFRLQKLLLESRKALDYIKRVITYLIAYSGNKDVAF